MRRAMWLAAVLAAGCGEGGAPRAVSVQLVDPLPDMTYGRYASSYAVVVERHPSTFLDRLGRRLGRGERPDTLAGVRVQFRPAVVRDSLLQGVDVMLRAFSYDVTTRELRRSPAPSWWGDVAIDLATPAFSPGGRYLAYLARPPAESLAVFVRSWPDGRVVARGPGGAPLQDRFPGPTRAAWKDSVTFAVAYNALVPRDFARMSVRGRVGDSILQVDAVSWFPYLDSMRAAAEQTRVDAAARLDRMVDSVPRLPASAFPQLPEDFARETDSLGCAVPQSYADAAPHNVVRGSFGAPGQEDWAVLCSRGGQSVILVHWGGPARCPGELATTTDRHYLMELSGGRVGFSRRITTTDSYYDYGENGRSVGRIKLDHQAIDDYYLEKASTVWFCRAGKWIELAGID